MRRRDKKIAMKKANILFEQRNLNEANHKEVDGKEVEVTWAGPRMVGTEYKNIMARLVTRRVDQNPLEDTPFWFIGGVYYPYESYKKI